MERIGRRLFETVFQVEGPGPGMFCMNQDHAGPDDAGRFTRPGERVLQQRRSETATFVPNISGEPSEQDRRYGLRLWHALQGPARRIGRRDGSGAQGVVAHHSVDIVIRRRDVDPSRPGGVSLACVPLQPLRQLRLLATELIELVVKLKRLRGLVWHPLVRFEDALSVEKPPKTGIIPRLSVQDRDETLPLRWPELEAGPIGEHTLGLEHRSIHHEVRQTRVRGFGGAPHKVVGLWRDAKVPAPAR